MDVLTLDVDGFAIPYPEIKRLVQFFSFGHPYRMAFSLIALTGCRISELKNIGRRSFFGEYVLWKTGKNQTGYRKEKLPPWFYYELEYYFRHYPSSDYKLFPNFNPNRLRDVLNKEVRPVLGGDWLKKRFARDMNSIHRYSYLYQLKGLRHSFATLEFYNQFIKWGGTMAVEFTCRRLQHSNYKITASHYICNFKQLEIEKYVGKSIAEIIYSGNQMRIPEFV